jgi:hypothetical protein
MTLLCGGCGDDDARSLRWRVSFEDASLATRAYSLEARILEGGCTGTDIWEAAIRIGDATQPVGPPELGSGTFGFEVTARDVGCVRFATGCTEQDLPVDDGAEVLVELIGGSEMTVCSLVLCEDGECVFPDGGIAECPAGSADCNFDPLDGCEVDTGSVDHCGGCDQPCRLPHADEGCSSEVCVISACDEGWADCDGLDETGCETSLRTVENCGACGTACSLPHAAETCEAGRCELVACHPGWDDCDDTIGNGCEANLREATSCGACGTTCDDSLLPLCGLDAAGERACVATCLAPTTMCGTGCVDVAADPDNCGACGTACTFAHGIGSCSASACLLSACEPLWSDCDMDSTTGCETPLYTATDCGSCGSSCVAAVAVTSCVTGDCIIDECFGEYGDCDGEPATGCEADLASAATCGACTTSCDARSPACGVNASGDRVCLASCMEPAASLCGDRCEDTQRDLSNCGSCGNVCTVADGTPRCVGGECLVATCDPDHGDCDGLGSNGCETDLLTAVDHCGACGAACSGPDAACAGGECMSECPAGMGNCDEDEANGCETPLSTIDNCGACGRECAPANGTGDCSSGTCRVGACGAGFDDCDGSSGNGCETRLESDVANCGSCGTRCTPPRCCMGMCC